MGTSLRITSMIVLLIGVHLIIPKISDAANAFSNSTVGNTLTLKSSYPVDKGVNSSAQLNSYYQPQNYGGPDSTYGSGTR